MREGPTGGAERPTTSARAARELTAFDSPRATLPNILAPERRANGLAHGHERLVARRRRIVAHVELDTVGDGHAPPARGGFVFRRQLARLDGCPKRGRER